MFRVVLLMVGIMAAIFTVVANIADSRTGGNGGGFNPLREVARFMTKTLNSADRLAPNLSGAIDRVDLRRGAPAGTTGDVAVAAVARLDISNANFSSSSAAKSVFAGVVMNNTQFVAALLDGASFEGASGAGANFAKARMEQSNFTAAHLPGADFSGAKLARAAMRAGDFTGANFAGADLTAVSLSGATLSKANAAKSFAPGGLFVDAVAVGADFSGADLRAARFANATLSDAKFAGADLAGAEFIGAKLKGADLSAASGVTAEQLASACGDASTKLPHGLSLSPCP